MTFGEKLKSLRQQNGITQDELADKLYVTRTAVSKWENDRGLPALDTMKQISLLFGVTLDELVSDDDVRSARLAEDKKAKAFRIPALCAFALTVAFAFMTAYLSKWCYSGGGSFHRVRLALEARLQTPRRPRKRDGIYSVARRDSRSIPARRSHSAHRIVRLSRADA